MRVYGKVIEALEPIRDNFGKPWADDQHCYFKDMMANSNSHKKIYFQCFQCFQQPAILQFTDTFNTRFPMLP